MTNCSSFKLIMVCFWLVPAAATSQPICQLTDEGKWFNPNPEIDLDCLIPRDGASSSDSNVISDPYPGPPGPLVNGNTVGVFNKRPAPGYTWLNPDDPNDLRVRWNPGEVHEDYAHVFASDTEGMWRAEEGYSWGPNASSEDLTVLWLPGVAHPVFPHVVTREEEGKWGPDEGYEWANPGSSEDWSVYWEPGKAHGKYSHVVAGSEEGKWITVF